MQLSKHIDKGLWTLATNGLKALYGVIFTVWIIAVLPENSWGEFYLVQTTFIALSQLALSLSMAPYVKFYYEEGEKAGLQSNAFLLYLAVVVPGVTLLVLGRQQLSLWLHSAALAQLIFFVPLLFAASFGKLAVAEIFKATHQIREFFFTELAYITGNLIFILGIYFQRGLSRPEDLLLPMTISYACASVLSIWLARRRLVWRFRLAKPLLRKMVGFGKYTLGTVSTSSVFAHADTYIVGMYLDPGAVGLLAAVKVWLHGFQLYRQSMALLVFPAFARLHAERRTEDLRAFYEKGIYYSHLLLFAMVLGLVLFAGIIFDVILQKYPEGPAILRLFALSGLFIGWQVFGESLLSGIGQPARPFFLRVCGGILNLGLNILLIGRFGIGGAVWASLASLAFIAFFITVFVRREIHFTFAGIVKRSFDILYFFHKQKNGKTPPHSDAAAKK